MKFIATTHALHESSEEIGGWRFHDPKDACATLLKAPAAQDPGPDECDMHIAAESAATRTAQVGPVAPTYSSPHSRSAHQAAGQKSYLQQRRQGNSMRHVFKPPKSARAALCMPANLLAAAILSASALGSGQVAAGEFSGSVALLSHYKWAGADQNFYEDKQIFPTLQASVFYTFDSGIYVGNWASTIKFLENNRIDSTAYLGYFTKLGPGALDVSVGYNFYPGAAHANTTSLYAIYSLSYFSLKWTGVISDKYVGLPDGRGRQAIALAAKYDLNDLFAVKGEVGRLFLTSGLKRQGLQEKSYFLAGVDYKLKKDLILGAVVTGASPINAQRIGWRDKTRLVLSLTQNF